MSNAVLGRSVKAKLATEAVRIWTKHPKIAQRVA